MNIYLISIPTDQYPDGQSESGQAKKSNMGRDLCMACDRLFAQGNLSGRAVGNGFISDELYYFESEAAAREHFGSEFKKWESFHVGEDEGCDIQGVLLYGGGHPAAAKQTESTQRIEVEHE
jgi:hypothetical protein